MSNLLEKINLDAISDVEIDIEELAKKYSEDLASEGILKTKSPRCKSEGKFESKIWISHIESIDAYKTLDFSRAYDMVALKLISSDDLIIFKCFMADELLTTDQNFRASSTRILNLFIDTQGFKSELIHSNQGNYIQTYIEDSKNNEVKEKKVSEIRRFIKFLDRVDYCTEGTDKLTHILQQYTGVFPRERRIRKLPSPDHIFHFNHYINDFFFNVDESEELLVKIYYPILIWWKLTNVIPMRPSELATQTDRDCLIQEEDKYYLKVKRIKLSKKYSTGKNSNKGRIPVLNRLEITKEIYDMIDKYIKFTDFAQSKTLFSWEAMVFFKGQHTSKKMSDSNYRTGNFRGGAIAYSSKFNRLSFSASVLDNLLQSFYSHIIIGKYGYSYDKNEQLDLGDTRHLAFCNLFLQGVSPIEIAMLGGHTTLEMQDSYTNHVQYYINNEVLDYISDKSMVGEEQKIFRSLKDIILNKPWLHQLGIDLTQYDKVEDGIGYCLLDNNANEYPCEKVPNCIFCDKWWCEPTNDNYIKAKKYILNTEVSPLNEAIKTEEQFFINIINQSKMVNVDGLLEIDKSDSEAIKAESMKLKSKADRLAFYKAALIEKS